MWKRICNAVNKIYLAQELRSRGVCLHHGTKLVPDRSHGIQGYGGVISSIPTCRACEDEQQVTLEQYAKDFEAETLDMWEAYRKL